MPDTARPIPKIGRTTHFIDGSWAPTDGPTFPDRNPYNAAAAAATARSLSALPPAEISATIAPL